MFPMAGPAILLTSLFLGLCLFANRVMQLNFSIYFQFTPVNIIVQIKAILIVNIVFFFFS